MERLRISIKQRRGSMFSVTSTKSSESVLKDTLKGKGSGKNASMKRSKNKRWSKSIQKKLPTSISKGRESLLDVVSEHRTDELSKVLDSGVDIGVLDPDGKLLLKATEMGFTDMVASLLRSSANIYETGEGHLNPLHLAAKVGYTGILSILISHGARVNEPSKYERRTALHIAVLEGRHEVMDLLLCNGASVNVQDIYGQTPLHMATSRNNARLVQLLVDHGAEVDRINNDGWTSLHIAAEAGLLEMIKLLLKHNASLTAQTKYGRTPLHWACEQRHLKAAVHLTEQGSRLNMQDSNGKTPAEATKCLQLKRFLINSAQNRQSFRIFSGEIPKLNLALRRSQSPYAHTGESTIDDLKQWRFSPTSPAISEEAGTASDNDQAFSQTKNQPELMTSVMHASSSKINFRRSVALSASDSDYLSESPLPIDDSDDEVDGSAIFETSKGHVRSRSKSCSVLVHPTEESGQVIELDIHEEPSNKSSSRQRSLTLSSLPNVTQRDKTEEINHESMKIGGPGMELQAKLFQMINKVNKNIGDLEAKVSHLQLEHRLSDASIPSSICSDVSLTSNNGISRDNDVTNNSRDFSDAENVSTTESGQYPVIDHMPVDPNRLYTKNSNVVCDRLAHQRKSVPTPMITVSKSSPSPTNSRLAHTKQQMDISDSVSIGGRSSFSIISIQDDVKEVQEQIQGMKNSFLKDSDQIARLLMKLEHGSSTC